MHSNQVLKYKIIRFTIISLISLVASLMLHYFTANESGKEVQRLKQFEQVLRLKEDRLMSTLETLLQKQQNNVPAIELYNHIESDLFQDEGLSAFLYQDDSLVFWSNNNVPADNFYNTPVFSKSFINYGNGWFRVLTARNDNFTAVGLILVKNDFPYQNQYLTNDFQKDFNLSNAEIDTLPGNYDFKSTNGEFLFSIDYPDTNGPLAEMNFIIFGLLIICFVSIIFLLFYLYHLFDFFKRHAFVMLLAFFVDASLFRFILLYFKIPGFLYSTDLFSPYHYATSFFSPSLGDLFVNSIFILSIAWLFYSKFNFSLKDAGKKLRFFLQILLVFISCMLFYLLLSTTRKLVVDSNIELNLNNIFYVDIYSALAFLALTPMVMGFFLISARFISIIASGNMNKWSFTGMAVVVVLVTFPVVPGGLFNGPGLIHAILLLIYLLSLFYFSGKKRSYNITGALFYIVFFSLTTTFILDYYHDIKEKEKRSALAADLGSRRDPLMEYEFQKIKKQMQSDQFLKKMIWERKNGADIDNEIISYINDNYLKTFGNNYELLITICQRDEVLNIQPGGYIENCHSYFDGLIHAPGIENAGPDLFFQGDRVNTSNYIACVNFVGQEEMEQDTLKIFTELFYKYVSETGLGYPDLLIEQKTAEVQRIPDYSYAKFFDNKLIYKNGEYSYHLGFKPYEKKEENSYFVDMDGYNHFILTLDEHNKVIVSKKNLTFLDLAAPFSYLFILFSLTLLVFLLGYILSGGYQKIEFNFSNQLQASIIIIIIVSFLILGMITRSNIIHLYNDKNRDNLSEKTFSVLTELEHKLGNEPELSDVHRVYISEYLDKFSRVFFSDINLYDTSGALIASSRPQIFEEGLLSARMNTCAFYKLSYEQSLLYIQNERIGKQEYLSAYIPFRNNNDQIIAYLNLPYFAKQTELRKEIADFLAAYINVYVLLIVLAVMVTVMVSRFITRPLQLIREKMRHIGLGKPNEKIMWKKKDEIGNLVDEYNRMIDELAISAELLARSERESAWREMAKQVAHEIKNPLTPMKLSVQYLQKAYDEKSPDWEKRLQRFTRTIVEQIDSLSEIASEFSDFAKMPATNIEKIELTGIIKSAADLYQHHRSIRILINNPEKESFVTADKRQLLRAFNNLIQNAVQAIGKEPDGLIRITVFRDDQYYRVEVYDNGIGITEVQAEKIFSPSFTTKSSGMGLGLAMVKSIMTTINGTVSFVSKPGEGTTFLVKIPIYIENQFVKS